MPRRPRLASLFALLALGVALAGCAPAQPGEPSSPSPSPPPSSSMPAPAGSFSPMLPPDRDGDGIADKDDRCPDEYEDCDGFDDDDGCPDPDNDRDGIADACDKCPFDPGDPPDGCPRRLRIEGGSIRIVETVRFARGSDVPSKASTVIFDEVARVLHANPRFELLEVIGHASGDEPNAQRLSERRARRSRDELLSRGIAGDRVVARGEGASKPIDTNDTAPGRERNRRVEWRLARVTEPPSSPPRPPGQVPVGPGPTPYCPGLASVPPPLPPPPGGCPRREPVGR